MSTNLMADTEPTKHPIDSLESTLALVLKETGKFFRASQSNDSRQVGVAKAAIAQTIPAANNRFHEALDEIEIEIIRAKSVFERDLSSIRTKRAERERAAADILKARSPNSVAKKIPPKSSPKETEPITVPSAADQVQLPPEEAASDDMRDISMTEDLPRSSGQEPPSQDPNTSNDIIKTGHFSIPQQLPQDPEQPKGLAISLGGDPSTSAPNAPDPEPETTDPAPNESNQEASAPASLQDADFDSMFNDADLPTTTDEIDFDLAFPTDETAAPTDLLNESAFQNISMPGSEQNPNNITANEDITTLLPGLENYVNGGGNDFAVASSIPDISSLSSGMPNNTNSSTAKMGTGMGEGINSDQIPSSSSEQPGNAPIESSFEDMFGLDSYMNGTGDDDDEMMGGSGEVGEFDEDWFNGI